MYEIKTADLAYSRDMSKAVINGIFDGSLDVKKGNTLNNAVSGIIRSVSTDIKARTMLPKLIESESKLIEAQKAEPQKVAKK